jgi:hypothetical protein
MRFTRWRNRDYQPGVAPQLRLEMKS